MSRMVDAELLLEEIDEKIRRIYDLLDQCADEHEEPSFLNSANWRRKNGSLYAWECLRDFVEDFAEDRGNMYDVAFNEGFRKGFIEGKNHKESGFYER